MSESRSDRNRSFPLDMARGLAVIAVVANHALFGLKGSGIVDSASLASQTGDALFMFRMSALALLIGLFIPSGVRKKGASRYIAVRVLHLGYLYFLWSLMLGAAVLAFPLLQNTPTNLADVLRLWAPRDQLWFLPFMALATCVVVLARAWGGWRRVTLGLGVFALISVLLWGRNVGVVGMCGISLIVFVQIGAAIGKGAMANLLGRSMWQWSVALVLATGLFIVSLTWNVVPPAIGNNGVAPLTAGLSLVSSLTGIVALLSLSRILANVPHVNRLGSLLGRNTMPVFLMHLLIVIGVRQTLIRFGIVDPIVHITLGVGLGVTLPVVVSLLTNRLGLTGLFDLPFSVRARISRYGIDEATRGSKLPVGN